MITNPTVKFYQSNRQPSSVGAILALLILFGLPYASAQTEPSDDNRSDLEIVPPDNWYQVEVILFTQQGNAGGETAPKDYQLSFPENWLELVDPNMPSQQNGFPLAEGALLSRPSLDRMQTRVIPRAQVEDPAVSMGQNLNAKSPKESPEINVAESEGLDGTPQFDQPNHYDAINSAADIAEPMYTPEYEAPFRLLDPEYRGLNDSAKALARRQYNVVFHESWRFAADSEEASPWIVIKAGQRNDDRFQVEGTLRFYKSRFLHFEPNLWLLEFANDSSQMINLPKLPVKPDPLANAIELSEAFVDFEFDNPPFGHSPELINSPELTNSPEPANNSAYPTTKMPLAQITDDLSPLLVTSQVLPKTYPVADVWVLNQSKRIDEGEVYYLDHPKMGAIVTITSYQPELLNPPEPKRQDPEGQTAETTVITGETPKP